MSETAEGKGEWQRERKGEGAVKKRKIEAIKIQAKRVDNLKAQRSSQTKTKSCPANAKKNKKIEPPPM